MGNGETAIMRRYIRLVRWLFLAEKKGDKLTRTETEVLSLLTDEFLSPKKIAIRRKTTARAVQMIISILRKKGALNTANKATEKKPSLFRDDLRRSDGFFISSGQSSHYIRLHRQEFRVRLLFRDERYVAVRNKANVIVVDGNTVRLDKDSVEVYSGHSFVGDDVTRVTAESFRYWGRFFVRLEQELKVLLVKAGHQNVKLVNHHYSEVNNELAKECNVQADKIRVYGTEDGKLWFLIDNSFNLSEAETVHPQDAARDMADVVRPFFNDLRENRPGTLSDVVAVIGEIARSSREVSEKNEQIAALLKLMANTLQTTIEVNKTTTDQLQLIVSLMLAAQTSNSDLQSHDDSVSKEKQDYFG